mmetsp:Transcript_34705/g.55569  ORF Transcript_34705/g.55569 Transcript_34705/m.55569 type:complete len:221 (+) Transcript_34705:2311-2973(+)
MTHNNCVFTTNTCKLTANLFQGDPLFNQFTLTQPSNGCSTINDKRWIARQNKSINYCLAFDINSTYTSERHIIRRSFNHLTVKRQCQTPLLLLLNHPLVQVIPLERSRMVSDVLQGAQLVFILVLEQVVLPRQPQQLSSDRVSRIAQAQLSLGMLPLLNRQLPTFEGLLHLHTAQINSIAKQSQRTPTRSKPGAKFTTGQPIRSRPDHLLAALCLQMLAT